MYTGKLVTMFCLTTLFSFAVIEFYMESFLNKDDESTNKLGALVSIVLVVSGFAAMSGFLNGYLPAILLIGGYFIAVLINKKYGNLEKAYFILSAIIFLPIYYFLSHWLVAIVVPSGLFVGYYFAKKGMGSEPNGTYLSFLG